MTSARRSTAAAAGTVVLVAAAYTAVAVVWTWPLATVVGTHTVLRVANTSQQTHDDQAFSISAAARNAAAIRSAEWSRLIHWRTCYPLPKAATLGEHAIELGILALPGYLATGNPVVAYNTACLLVLLIAGLSTFCLVRHWSGSPGAGFFAGLAFAFHPDQINDLTHPFVMGIHWLPLVLLAFERLMETGRIRFALLLAVAGTLQSWVGAYPLIVFAAFAGPYGVVRLVQLRRTLDARRAGLLTLAVAIVVGGAVLVLAQYAAGHAWGVHRRQLLLVPFSTLWPGGNRAVGGLTVLLGLSLLGLRGSRPSPVPALVAGGLACVLLAGAGQPWPGGPRLAALYPRLADHVWMLGIARVPAAVRSGSYLAVSVLAGLALGRVLSRLGPRRATRAAVTAALSGALLVEYFDPAVAARVHGIPPTVALVPRRPEAAVLAAYEAFDAAGVPGPVVDVPFDDGRGVLGRMPYYTALAAYHGRETAACFSSHVAPSFRDVGRMVEELRQRRPEALVELAAAGLRNVVIHRSAGALATTLENLPELRVLYRSDQTSALRLTLAVAPHHDRRLLTTSHGTLRWFRVMGYQVPEVEVAVRNTDQQPWALPHPIAPLPARSRWIGAAGQAVTPWAEQTTMLPLALAGLATAPMRVPVDPPPKGCACRPEIEIPELGWRLGADQIDVSAWTRSPPAPLSSGRRREATPARREQKAGR